MGILNFRPYNLGVDLIRRCEIAEETPLSRGAIYGRPQAGKLGARGRRPAPSAKLKIEARRGERNNVFSYAQEGWRNRNIHHPLRGGAM